MSVTQKFLDQLRAELRTYPSGQVDDYIDYYAELISDRIASGESEAVVLHKVGSPKDAAINFKRDNAIDRAINKPTASNGIKALIAVLGVLSLPFLIPVVVLCMAVLVTGIALFVTCLAVLMCAAVAAVASTIDMAMIVSAGDAPFYLLLLVAGIAAVVVTLTFELIRGMLFAGRFAIRAAISRLKARHHSTKKHRQDATQDTSGEDQ